MKEEILKNITNGGYVNETFLKQNNITAKQCYVIVYREKQCNYCNNTSEFLNWKQGFKDTCENKECKKKHRKEKTEKTCLEKYGVKNISQLKEIKDRKLESSKKTCLEKYGVENPFQVKEFTCDENGKQKAHSDESKEKRNKTLLEKYKTTDPLSINNGRERGISKCNNDSAIKEKRKQTCAKKYGGETPFSSQSFQEYLKDILEEKYGVRNISYLQETKDKISKANTEKCTSEEMKKRRRKVDENGESSISKQKKTNIINGKWVSDELKTEFELYYREVWKITNLQNIKSLDNYEKRGHINDDPDAYHLDHKYSVFEGYRQGISPEIIGNIVNLEMIHNKQNTKKREKCSITKEVLLESFYGK